jgi:3-oxoacyl-[acyl-carrier-protein] synthase III
MIADISANGRKVGITGIGAYAPEKVLTNDELSRMVDTSDEWITERTGIRQRHIAAPDQAASDLALPACQQALERAGARPEEIDYVIVGTCTPDMVFPTTATLLADKLGATNAAAYDVLAGCTGFLYALAQGYGAVASGLATKALVVGAEALSKITNWEDRATCVLFGDGAGAAVLEPVSEGGFIAFELGADGAGGKDLMVPAGGSRAPAAHETIDQDLHYIHMNGPEIYRFATRVMVASAQKTLEHAGMTVDELDLYVPHQANKRIIDHAARILGLPAEKVFINLERYGNTSSASVPLCLVEADEQGLLNPGSNVLLSAVGAGLTWGSALMTWSDGR